MGLIRAVPLFEWPKAIGHLTALMSIVFHGRPPDDRAAETERIAKADQEMQRATSTYIPRMATTQVSQRRRMPVARTQIQLFRWVVGFSAVLLAGGCAYYRMFTGFSRYDDDGYLLVGLRSLLQGRRLYDDIYSQYGPFYYAFHWLIYSAIHLPVSHDAERFIGVALWLLSAALWARAVYLLTRVHRCGPVWLSSLLLGSLHSFPCPPAILRRSVWRSCRR